MATNSNWSKSVPSGQSAIAQGDDAIRSFKSHMQAWWEDEHYATDGSASSAGVHKHGSARVYIDALSNLSNPTGDGGNRVFMDNDGANLWISNPSTSSWSKVSSNINTGSATTWTGLNEFTSGISASQLTVTGGLAKVGVFGNILSGSTYTNLASVPSGSYSNFTIGVTGAAVGDHVLISVSQVGSNTVPTTLGGYVSAADIVSGTWYNLGPGAQDESAQTYTALVFKFL